MLKKEGVYALKKMYNRNSLLIEKKVKTKYTEEDLNTL